MGKGVGSNGVEVDEQKATTKAKAEIDDWLGEKGPKRGLKVKRK